MPARPNLWPPTCQRASIEVDLHALLDPLRERARKLLAIRP